MDKVVRKTVGEIRRSPARKREMARLAAKPVAEIDLSEMPELDEDFWKRAVRSFSQFRSSQGRA